MKIEQEHKNVNLAMKDISMSEGGSSSRNNEENEDDIKEIKREVNLNPRRRLTLAKVSHFRTFNDAETKKNVKTAFGWQRVREIMYKMVDNLFMHILILFLAVYSLYHEDLMILCLPKDVDDPFEHTTEAVFFFFLLEMIIMIISKKKFIGSFYFYLDIVSLISLLPEVHLIWYPLLGLLSGSSASRYLRLLRLTNFIKVIRVAKVIDASKKLKSNVITEKKNNQLALGTLIFQKGRKRTILQDQRELLDKMIAMSIKYNLDFDKDDRKHDKKILIEESEVINKNQENIVKKTVTFNPLISQSSGIAVVNKISRKSTTGIDGPDRRKSNMNTIFKLNNANKNQLRTTKTFHPFLKKKSSEASIGDKIYPAMVEELKNDDDSMEINFKNIPLDTFDPSVPVEENAKRLSVFYTTVKPFVEDILINYKKIEKEEFLNSNSNSRSNINSRSSRSISKSKNKSKSNSSSQDEMDSEEEAKFNERLERNKRAELPIALKLALEQPKEEEEEEHVEIEMVREELVIGKHEEKNEKKKDEDLLREVSTKSNSKLERRLTEGITQQVVIIIMILLIALPMIEYEFIFGLVYSEEQIPNRHVMCIDLILLFMNLSIYNQTYLPNLNSSIDNCFYSKSYLTEGSQEVPPEVVRFIYANFNESQIFYDLQNQTNFFNSSLLKVSDYSDYLDRYRINFDYEETIYGIDDYNNVTFAFDNREYEKINSITGLLKSTYVAIVLIISAYVFSKDINEYIIIPLDKIFTKMNMNLKHLEIFDIKEAPEDEPNEPGGEKENYTYSHLDFEDLFNNGNVSKLEISVKSTAKKASKREKNSLETIYIDTSIHKLLKMISVIIGKIAFYVIPNSDLEKDLKLNLNTPSVKFTGVCLILKISNTEELFSKYLDKAPVMLSKVYSIFHSIGIISLGEPFFNDNFTGIIWKKDKKEWNIKTKSYAIDLVKKHKGNFEPKNVPETDKNKRIEEEVYALHYADLSILCGLKFIHVVLENLKETMKILIDCHVNVNLLTAHGDMFQGLIGNNDFIDENYSGSPFSESLRILENLASVNKNKNVENIPKFYLFPSLFIDENICPFVSVELKKFILPYEIFFDNVNNKKMIYRHYYNYRFSHEEPISLVDSFKFEKLHARIVFDQRSSFEKMILRDTCTFNNYLFTDDVYQGITSDLTPTMRTIINLSFQTFEISDYDKALSVINDLKNIIPIITEFGDEILYSKLMELKKIIETKKERLGFIAGKERNYTKILE